MKKSFLIVLYSLISLLSPVMAQVYNITAFNRESGLLQSQVMAVIQDSRGYLWLGTHRGVFKYDGKRFQPYSTNEGLTGKLVSAVIEDHHGYLWVGTSNGISKFDGAKFVENFTIDDGLSDNNVQVLMEDRQGNIWVGLSSQGINLVRNDSIIQTPLVWPVDNGVHNIQALLEDKMGRKWVGTTDGLYVNESSNTLKKIKELPENLVIYSLEQDHEGTIWLGTDRGVYRYNGEQYIYHDLSDLNLPDNQVFCILVGDSNQVWLGTGRGIIRYKEGKFQAFEEDNRRLDFQMPSGTIDREGNIWFGTDGGGLRKLSDGIFEEFTMDDGFTSNLAKSFLEDKNGNIWISTRDRGINVFRDNRVVKTYSMANGLGGNGICSSFEDSRGDFWFASYNGTLTQYNGSRFKVWDEPDNLNCNSVYIVGEDQKGNIWVGTDNGVFLINNGKITRHFTTDDGLLDNTIYALQVTPNGKIWLGTSLGVSCYDKGQFKNFRDDKKNIGSNVFTLLMDKYNRIWAGSSVGLSFFSGDSAHHVWISGAEGAHTVVALIVEAEKYLWIGTENGVYQLDVDEFVYHPNGRAKFEHFTDKDGLPSLECNANAAFIDSEGSLWLGTADGAIRKPMAVEREEKDFPPLLYITEARVKNQNWAQEYIRRQDSSQKPRPIRFNPNENDLEFEWIGISLSSPQQIEYKYMLEGQEQEWSGSTRQTQIIYGNLAPGAYTFKVQAKKESSLWTDAAEANFAFVILPPFWQRWWFISLMTLLVLGIAFLIYRMINNRRKRAREERRIRDTAEKLQLEHQALYAMMNPHFTFNALQSIQYFIHRQDKIAANKFLSSFAKLIRKNLESTKSDFITLAEEVERLNLYLSLEKMRFPEKFDYKVNVEPGLEVHDTLIPPMIFQPFVENSIKHGIMPLDANGVIEVNLSAEGEDHMKIVIKDNGIGIEASRKQKADRPSDHVSKGMQITLDRLALFARMTGKKYDLKISEIKNAEGKVEGTMVEMVLPVKESLL
ncbi:MAG: two-component regulator propeller domain-containing protein [Bacteroidia bacterium]